MFLHIRCLALFLLSRFGYLSNLKDAIVGGVKIQMLYQEQLVGRESLSLTDLIVVTFLRRTSSGVLTTLISTPKKWIRDQVISQLNLYVFKLETIIQVLARERKNEYGYYLVEEELRLCLEAEERMRLEHEKNIIEELSFMVKEAKRMKLEEEKLLQISQLKKKAAKVYEFKSCENYIGKVKTYKGKSR
ncbi:hypothetical protein Tco_0616349 [Tanacetum coccineum]